VNEDRIQDSLQRLNDDIKDLGIDVTELRSDVKHMTNAFAAYSASMDKKLDPIQLRHGQFETILSILLWLIPAGAVAAVMQMWMP